MTTCQHSKEPKGGLHPPSPKYQTTKEILSSTYTLCEAVGGTNNLGRQRDTMGIIIVAESFVTINLAGGEALQIQARVTVMTAERLKGSDRSPGLFCPGVASVPRRGSGSIQCRDTSKAINSFSHNEVQLEVNPYNLNTQTTSSMNRITWVKYW